MMIGPFDLKSIIITVMIVAATSVAMYLLKGALSIGLTISLWILVIAIVSIAAIIFLLASAIFNFYRYGKEGFIFATARKLGIPVYIDAELGTENAEFILGEKHSPKDVTFADEESGIKIDPSLLSQYARPMRFPWGLDIFIYTYYNFMPQSPTQSAAFKAINDYFITECKDLSFLTIKEFVELISDPEHYLARNASIKLNKYFELKPMLNADGNPVVINGKQQFRHVRQFEATNEKGEIVWKEQDISLETMVLLIAKARDDIMKLQIKPGLIAGTEAFKYNSVPYSSQHLSHAFMLFLKKMEEQFKERIDRITWAVLILAVCGGIAIVLAIIFTLGPGAAK